MHEIEETLSTDFLFQSIIIVLQMIFANRFFHSDCHNGNILVKLDNNKLIFTFIDFGLVSKINSKNRDIICNMFKYRLIILYHCFP